MLGVEPLCQLCLRGIHSCYCPAAGTYSTASGPWHTLTLTVVGDRATGTIDDAQLFSDAVLPTVSSGWVAIGTGRYFAEVTHLWNVQQLVVLFLHMDD